MSQTVIIGGVTYVPVSDKGAGPSIGKVGKIAALAIVAVLFVIGVAYTMRQGEVSSNFSATTQEKVAPTEAMVATVVAKVLPSSEQAEIEKLSKLDSDTLVRMNFDATSKGDEKVMRLSGAALDIRRRLVVQN